MFFSTFTLLYESPQPRFHGSGGCLSLTLQCSRPLRGDQRLLYSHFVLKFISGDPYTTIFFYLQQLRLLPSPYRMVLPHTFCTLPLKSTPHILNFIKLVLSTPLLWPFRSSTSASAISSREFSSSVNTFSSPFTSQH